MPRNHALGLTAPQTTYILALVTEARTCGYDVTETVTQYTSMDGTSQIIDLQSIEAVVGRVPMGDYVKRCGVIDRSGDLARTVFTESDSADEGEHDAYDY